MSSERSLAKQAREDGMTGAVLSRLRLRAVIECAGYTLGAFIGAGLYVVIGNNPLGWSVFALGGLSFVLAVLTAWMALRAHNKIQRSPRESGADEQPESDQRSHE